MTLIGRIATELKRWDDRRHSSKMDELDRYAAARAAFAKSRVANRLSRPLDEVIMQAWAIGQDIDLSGIGYGPAHSKSGERFVTAPQPYYFFLSGLVRSQGYKRIFEIGTHYGGSILAMRQGVEDPDKAKIVTVDVTDLNPAIHAARGINKIVGDANTEYVIKKTVMYFDAEPIDLMFIDADHLFLPTITNVGLFCVLLQPRMVVIDDIALNDSMRAMWNLLCATYGPEAVNGVDVIPEIRPKTCGFGLLRLR